ncbi:MAG: hypothetical protein QXH10_10750 [Ignisphaera sp.]
MFERVKAWVYKRKIATVLALIGQTEGEGTIDVSSIMSLVNSLIGVVLPILLVVMIIKVITSLFKNLADAF